MSKLPDGVITTSIVTPERRFVVVAALPEHAAEIRTVFVGARLRINEHPVMADG